ncbi:cuticle protein 7-like [Macrobrachium rosenbergii]|uniref:cuticle protein 7-like n=1 Tax=Macrobrachium rosenbergii TaxID=79674 RepID=UPI0034D3AB7C
MSSKIALLCLAAVALARPDRPAQNGYGYSAPSRPLSYAPPAPAYKAPEPSYSAPAPSYKAPSYEEKHEEGMPFDFSFEVQDEYQGLDFAHDSDSDGKVVNGEYHVLLPDGRTQIVKYTADHYNGYQADVKYEGEAKYPETKPYKPAPSYGAPAPSYGTPAPTYQKPKSLYGAPSY